MGVERRRTLVGTKLFGWLWTPVAFPQSDVITVYSGANEWKTALAYGPGREDDAYLIVIDGGGIVRWLHHGMFDDVTAAQLRGVLLSLARHDGAGRQQQEEEWMSQ